MSVLSRFNPAERRLVIGAGLLVFGLINFVWVWPHFSDLSDLRQRLNTARTKHETYRNAIDESEKLKIDLAKLKGQGGDVPPEDQALQFLRAIQEQANLSGVGVNNYGRQSTSTNNPFFLELSQTITVQSFEKPLVDFFYNLGTDRSMIRIRSLSIHPDAARQQLAGTITLIASYQKKARPQSQPAPAPKGTTPAAAPVPKPADIPGSPANKPVPPRIPAPTKK